MKYKEPDFIELPSDRKNDIVKTVFRKFRPMCRRVKALNIEFLNSVRNNQRSYGEMVSDWAKEKGVN